VIKFFIRRIGSKSAFRPSPRIVIHPLGEHEGGLTQVETRALRELALGDGASEAHVWQGPVLSDEQVSTRSFPGHRARAGMN
jgi:rod shape-determining protein MreB